MTNSTRSMKVETTVTVSWTPHPAFPNAPPKDTTVSTSSQNYSGFFQSVPDDEVLYNIVNGPKNQRGRMSYTRAKREMLETTTTMDAQLSTHSARPGSYDMIPRLQVVQDGMYYRTTKTERRMSGFPAPSTGSVPAPSYILEAPKIEQSASAENFDIFDYCPQWEDYRVADLRLSAREDFSAKVSEDMTFNGPLFLSELSRTLSMIKAPAFAAARYTERFGQKLRDKNRRFRFDRKAGLRAIREQAEMIADSWLEYQYGWKPLQMDIREAINASETKCLDNVGRVLHLNRSLSLSPETYEYPATANIRVNGAFSKYTLAYSEQIKYAAAVEYIDTGSLSKILRSVGVMPSQLPLTLWERTPFSFVVDYFANINNVLSYSLDTQSRVRFTSCTVRSTLDVNGAHMWRTHVNDTGEFEEDGWLTGQSKIVRRSVDPKVGDLIIPHFRVPKVPQIINLAALTTSLTIKKVRHSL